MPSETRVKPGVIRIVNDKKKQIAQVIREYRKKIGLTQGDLAKRLSQRGYSYATSTVGWWENERSLPPLHEPEFLQVLADSLEVSVGLLIDEMGIYDSESRLTMDDLTPDERDLILAYRAKGKDFRRAMLNLAQAD